MYDAEKARVLARRDHVQVMAQIRREGVRAAKRLGVPLIRKICHACRWPFVSIRARGRIVYCGRCSGEAHYARNYALAWVNRAVRYGRLLPPETFRCVDCDEWAEVWEHRDYSKPLQVEPVCKSCNALRGPGYIRHRAPEWCLG